MSVSLDLAKKQLFLFELDNVSYMRALVRGEAMREIMRDGYATLVYQKKLTAIENLPIEEKNILWLTAKDFAKDTLPKEKIVDLCKAFYCLEFLINEKN